MTEPTATSTGLPGPVGVESEAPRRGDVFPLQLFVVIIAALFFGREVLIPITLAVLLSFVLSPVVDVLRRIRVPKVVAVLLAAALAVGIVSGIGAVIGSQIAQLATGLPQYAETVQKKVEAVRSYTVGRISDLASRIGRPPPELPAAPGRAEPERQGASPQPVQAAPTDSPLAVVKNYLSTVLSPIETAAIVFIVAIFILLQKEDLRDRLIRLFGSDDLHRTTGAMDDAARRLSRYLLTQLAVNATFGVVVGAGLFFIGVPNPVLWGLLSALMRFVPYIGSFIAAGLPIALAAAVDPGWSMVIWTAALYAVVELLVSQAVEPMLYGHSTGMSPFAVVVAAIFWSWLWGPIGLILSMPLTLCLVVLGRHVEQLKFLDVLLGDRPALTPVESFYQRILAGDADEAQDHAERMLKEVSLSTYYDEVALKGLQLAAADAERGVLQPKQLDRIRSTITGLVAELNDHTDTKPENPPKPADATMDEAARTASPPPSGPGTPGNDAPARILCLAGRGPLDEAAAAMLAQLLGKHGLAARTAPHAAASREAIATLDLSGIEMVCISYLDIAGSPAHLRYLMQRLRRRLPGAKILVGTWPSDDSALTDSRVREVIGADYYATNLTQAVTDCVKLAS